MEFLESLGLIYLRRPIHVLLMAVMITQKCGMMSRAVKSFSCAIIFLLIYLYAFDIILQFLLNVTKFNSLQYYSTL